MLGPMTYTPRYAIVTASDSGIGKATAVALADQGLDIAHHLAHRLRRRGGHRRGGALARPEGLRRPPGHRGRPGLRCGDRRPHRQLGGLVVFVYNAGTGRSTLLVETSYEDWRHLVAVDLDGAYDAAKHGLGGLTKSFALELGQHQITVNCVARARSRRR